MANLPGPADHGRRLDALNDELDKLRAHIEAAREEVLDRRKLPDRRKIPRQFDRRGPAA